ncbi:MAG: nuclear transport factor 2 family protein [Cyclobacteriaceae bacterium]|nr:nuclear transport factor 2 family protein [Cyclobacteriaceae bacterium]
MKTLLIALLLLSVSICQGQGNPDLQSMINTERAFAKMAKDQNQRDAFLFYLTEDAVTSGPQGPVIGKEKIRQQKIGNGWLKWDVAFSDIATSGDFGYNTGPWEFRANKTDEKPVAFGEFNSIWKKQKDGSWKNVLDIGIAHKKGPSVDSIKLSTSKIITGFPRAIISGNPMMVEENKFLTAQSTGVKSAYEKYLSKEARLNHSGRLALVNTEEKQKFLSETELLSKVEPMGSDLSSSGDLGYVYGKAVIEINSNGKTENKIATYFRVWKREGDSNVRHSGDWKIVLDVLTY